MGYGEKAGDYWRGRYRLPSGKSATVKDPAGFVVRFRKKRGPERAANEAEAKHRTRPQWNPDSGREKFGSYVSRWYAVQDLALSTMQNYRHHIEEHLLPAFEHYAVADIGAADVGLWEKRERAA